MSRETVRSTDELFAEFSKALTRMDLIQNLILYHAKACGDTVGRESVDFFAEQIGKSIYDMYEYLNEIKLAMDVEAHRKI